MKNSKDLALTAVDILENKVIDVDLRYTLARFIKNNPGWNSISPHKTIADITGGFNSILRDVGNSVGKQPVNLKHKDGYHYPLQDIPLKKGQHVILFTPNLRMARMLAKQIAFKHTSGHLVFDASKTNETWLRSNLQKELRTKSIGIIPREGLIADGNDFVLRSDKIIEELADYIRAKTKTHHHVMGVSLTTTKTLLAMATGQWQSFVAKFERKATSKLHRLSSNWICIYCFSELQEPNYLRKMPGILIEAVHAHDVLLIQEERGEVLSGRAAVLSCYEKFLETACSINHDDLNI